MLRKASSSGTVLSGDVFRALKAELHRRLLGSASQSAAAPCQPLLGTLTAGYSTDASSRAGQKQPEAQAPSTQQVDNTGGAKRMRSYSFVPPAGTFPVALSGFPRTALREDILHFLPPLGLEKEDIKPAFDSNLRIMRFWVALKKAEHRDAALECSGRFLGLRPVQVAARSREEMAQALQTRFVGHSRGRYVLVTGLDLGSAVNDVMMMFHRFNLMPIAINIFHQWGDRIEERSRPQTGSPQQRPGEQPRRKEKDPPTLQAAVIRLETNEEAYLATRYCNHGFVKGSRINVRVLQ